MIQSLETLLTNELFLWRNLAKKIIEDNLKIISVEDLGKNSKAHTLPAYTFRFYLNNSLYISCHYGSFVFDKKDHLHLSLEKITWVGVPRYVKFEVIKSKYYVQSSNFIESFTELYFIAEKLMKEE